MTAVATLPKLTAWKNSSERQQALRSSIAAWIFHIALLVTIVLMDAIFSPYLTFRSPSWEERVMIILPGAVLAISAPTAITVSKLSNARIRFDRRVQVAQLNSKLEALALTGMNEVEDGKVSPSQLWAENRLRIDGYHQIAMSQADTSFQRAQFTAVAGLVLVVGFGVVAIFATTTAGAIAAGLIGVAASALAGYLGATFIKMHAQSVKQLATFSQQPFQEARLLSADRLIDSLDKEDRADAVKIVLSQLGKQDSVEQGQ